MATPNGNLVEGVIANLPLFKHSSKPHLAELARHARTQHVSRGTLIAHRGDKLQGLLAVAYGMVKLSLRGDAGEEKVIRLVGPGEVFGEPAAFLETPMPLDAIALGDTLLVILPAQSVNALIEREPQFARSMIASLSARMNAMVADMEATTLHGALERVASYLDSLADAGAPAPVTVRLPATKTVIAARLGVTKETFSRLLRELAQRGLVSIAKREITLLDRAELAHVAHSGRKAHGHAHAHAHHTAV
jgi:CRP-like cAMP-binding protein